MPIFRKRSIRFRRSLPLLSAVFAGFAASCSDVPKETGGGLPSSLSEVPAVRLSYRYEADVPPPTVEAKAQNDAEKFAAIKVNFESGRPQEYVVRLIGSPDGKRVAVLYNRAGDQPEDYRLDMYASDGTALRKVTSELMAVHFPDTISWSPDSRSIAFVAMLRAGPALDDKGQPIVPGQSVPAEPSAELPLETPADGGIDGNANAAQPAATAEPEPAATLPEAPAGILTFRTEQLYIADADGNGTRPLSQNENLIYYYYVWSDDSTKLATLAATVAEWQYVKRTSEAGGEVFVPRGRPRVIETNGRERLLDDALTTVQPVWSPDSTKIACGFDKQVRVYDAGGTVPTQAAIPLRNHLLLSSKAYDMEQAQSMGDANAVPAGNEQQAGSNASNVSNASVPNATLPDENTLASFNPIVALHWPSDDQLYFQTAFLKRMLNQTDSVASFPRWHRLIFTPQAETN